MAPISLSKNRFGEPKILPRIGAEYQAEIPPLEESGNIIERGNYSKESQNSPAEEKMQRCSDDALLLERELASESWSNNEKVRFLEGLYTFGKNFDNVKRFIRSKSMLAIQSFYYGKFYGSKKYRIWSQTRKSRGKKLVYKERISRSHKLRILPSEGPNTFATLHRTKDGNQDTVNYVAPINKRRRAFTANSHEETKDGAIVRSSTTHTLGNGTSGIFRRSSTRIRTPATKFIDAVARGDLTSGAQKCKEDVSLSQENLSPTRPEQPPTVNVRRFSKRYRSPTSKFLDAVARGWLTSGVQKRKKRVSSGKHNLSSTRPVQQPTVQKRKKGVSSGKHNLSSTRPVQQPTVNLRRFSTRNCTPATKYMDAVAGGRLTFGIQECKENANSSQVNLSYTRQEQQPTVNLCRFSTRNRSPTTRFKDAIAGGLLTVPKRRNCRSLP